MRFTRLPVRKLIDASTSIARRSAARLDSVATQRARQRRTASHIIKTDSSAQDPRAAPAIGKTAFRLKSIILGVLVDVRFGRPRRRAGCGRIGGLCAGPVGSLIGTLPAVLVVLGRTPIGDRQRREES